MTKRFIVRTKQGRKANKNGSAGEPPMPPPPSRTFLENLIDFVGAEGEPQICAKYASLCGDNRPVSQAIASNRPLMNELDGYLARALGSHLEANSSQVGVQSLRFAVLPGERPEFSLAEVRKAASSYNWSKVDGIASVRLSPVPQRDTEIPGIAVDVVGVNFGQDAKRTFGGPRRRPRASAFMNWSGMTWFPPGDSEAWRSAIHCLCSSPFTGLPPGAPFHDRDIAFGEEAPQGLRVFLAMMCRSQLPIGKMLFAFGAGKPILTAAMAQVEHSLKLQCKAGPEILHRDAILHFWFSELRRLGWDHISVPIVKIH